MKLLELADRLAEAERFFSNSEYSQLISQCQSLLAQRNCKELEEKLDQFPSKEFLYSNLVEKLKGKSVFRTLKKITEKKSLDRSTCLKGLFSLGTHIIIESEKNSEYGILLPDIYEKIGELLYRKEI